MPLFTTAHYDHLFPHSTRFRTNKSSEAEVNSVPSFNVRNLEEIKSLLVLPHLPRRSHCGSFRKVGRTLDCTTVLIRFFLSNVKIDRISAFQGFLCLISSPECHRVIVTTKELKSIHETNRFVSILLDEQIQILARSSMRKNLSINPGTVPTASMNACAFFL